jgi:rhamnosyl/mannosyltransferase
MRQTLLVMRITHIYKDYFPMLGGIENHVKQLAEAQAQRGHEVTVLVTQLAGQPASDEMMNGVRVVKTPRQLNVQSAPISLHFGKAVNEETAGADIAHLHAPYPIGEACNLYFGRARKTVLTWHSDIVRQKTLLRVYAPVLRRVVAKADRIIPTSDAYARTSPWLQDALPKCRVVPYGIDIAHFQQMSPALESQARDLRDAWTQRAGLANPLLLLCVGQLRYYKSFDTLIRALPQLPDVIVAIAGTGPMREAWAALATSLGVEQRVTFLGQMGQDALPACYRAADVFVLPSNSRAEAFGIVNLEAMARSLPLITTEVGSATSWVNEHQVTGLVVPPMDPNALAKAVEVLREDEMRRRMGEAARRRVEAHFTRERMVEGVEAVYRETLSR